MQLVMDYMVYTSDISGDSDVGGPDKGTSPSWDRMIQRDRSTRQKRKTQQTGTNKDQRDGVLNCEQTRKLVNLGSSTQKGIVFPCCLVEGEMRCMVWVAVYG